MEKLEARFVSPRDARDPLPIQRLVASSSSRRRNRVYSRACIPRATLTGPSARSTARVQRLRKHRNFFIRPCLADRPAQPGTNWSRTSEPAEIRDMRRRKRSRRTNRPLRLSPAPDSVSLSFLSPSCPTSPPPPFPLSLSSHVSPRLIRVTSTIYERLTKLLINGMFLKLLRLSASNKFVNRPSSRHNCNVETPRHWFVEHLTLRSYCLFFYSLEIYIRTYTCITRSFSSKR